jgi:mono/diheme cytochrome c family protein
MRAIPIALFLALTALPAQAQVPAPARPPGVTDSAIAWGKALFHGSANCSACHGVGGRGTDYGPPITGALWLHGPGLCLVHQSPTSTSPTVEAQGSRGLMA